MPNKNYRLAPTGLEQGLVTRAIIFQTETLREEDRSVEFILTTEAPARVFDWNRCEVITEVVRADGLMLPKTKKVPLLNSHDRSTVQNILGSVREIRQEGNQVVGRLYFSTVKEADDAFTKIKEGHLDSGSIGYQQLKGAWIEKGDTFTWADGTNYEGPMLLTTQWMLKEYSLVAIGADPNAKAREEVAEQTETCSREAVANLQQEIETMPAKTEQPIGNTVAIDTVAIDTEAIKTEARVAEQARAAKITELCAKHQLPALAAEMIRNDVTVEKAHETVLEAISARTTPLTGAQAPSFEVGKEASEKFRDAVVDGILLRTGMKFEKPADGANSMRGMGFTDIARECLSQKGINTRYMDKTEILQRALSVSDFPNVLANTANKSVTLGYSYAPSSWRMWAKLGILPDFKTASRISLDDAPDMIANPAGAEIEHGIFGDKAESIGLSTFARKLVITRQALMNDDLNIFNTIFRAFGYRAANLIEAKAFAVLLANAAMSDGEALFSTAHANIASSAAVVSQTSVNLAEIALMEQAAPNGTKLALNPRYLVCGSANRIAAMLLCNSTTDTTLTSGANYNPFADLQTIASPHVTGKKWFLMADPNQIDTVEVAFLNGKDTPTVYAVENSGEILGRTFVGYIDVGAKAIEHRGMYYNAGQ